MLQRGNFNVEDREENPSIRFWSTEFQQLTIVLRLLDTRAVTQICISYLEQFSKIGTAGGEYNAVRFEALAIAGQCDVHEILIVPQVLKRRRYTALVIVPSQTEVLRIYHRYVYSPIIRNNNVRYLTSGEKA